MKHKQYRCIIHIASIMMRMTIDQQRYRKPFPSMDFVVAVVVAIINNGHQYEKYFTRKPKH